MRIRLGLAFALLVLALVACSGEQRAAGKKHIAVIPKGSTNEFWKAVHAGAATAGRELGVEILWKGPLREDDRDEQIKVVEDMVVRGVDGIVLAPLDDQALVPAVEDADRQGIPVLIFDSDIAWKDRVSYVATDNYRGGILAAETLAEEIGEKGRVILLRYAEGSASTTQREAGFLETLAKYYPEVEVVSSNQYAGATTESAFKTSENLLITHEEVDGVFCPNESSTFGMLRALEESGRVGKVRLVGFDASEKLVEALRAGKIDGLVVQNPFMIGDLGVRVLVEHLAGEQVEKRIDTGVRVVTRDNLDDPDIARLVEPDLSILGD